MKFTLVLAILGAATALQAAPLAVVSAASYRIGALAPESIAAAFGTNLATPVVVTDSKGIARTAPIFYQSATQINFEIPAGTTTGTATVTIGANSSTTIAIANTAPGLFSADGTGSGVAAAEVITQTATPAFQCTGSICTTLPIPLNTPTAVELFGTGIRGATTVTCTLGGIATVPVLYTGPAPGFAGLDQVNISLPQFLSGSGILTVVLFVDGQATNPVTLQIAGSTATDRAMQIVSQMTLDEKIQSLHGIQDTNDYRVVPGIPRLGIPLLNITNGPAGATNGGPGHQGVATALPAPIGLAATWNRDTAALYGRIVGAETKALANGFLEGPDINIARVPQNGRSFEAYGEDPFLVGQLAAANIQGVQSQGVIAEAKHYAGNNQEINRATINDIIDERTLREIYLAAFEASVKQGNAGAVMCAYNQVNGAYSCENDLLMNQILKNQWGFNGFITSDFGAVHSTIPSALAGLDLEMPTGIYFTSALKTAVQAGTVPTSVIDDKLIRRFATMIRFGIFDNPPSLQPVPTTQDGLLARQIAEAGMVLLKNTGSLLPLNATQLHNIAVIGPYASKAKTGGGGSSLVVPAYTVDPVPGIQNRVGGGVTVKLATGSNIAQAVTLAQSADVAIVMVGDDEAEGADHAISLSGNQDALVAAIAAANPKTVVVAKTGSAFLMPWAASVPAILEAWYPGEEDGNAVAAVLFGDVNPSGKLPVTFPQALVDLPANTPAQYPGVNGVANYSEGVFVGYRYFDANNIQPLFPFGHGLSYTTFSYANLAIRYAVSNPFPFYASTLPEIVYVDFDITNTGPLPGTEVAQLYVGMPATSAVPQPPQQLKGFQSITLQPGASGHISIPLDSRAFSYWDINTHAWVIAPGTYTLNIGSSSRDIRLTSQITPH